MLDSNFFVFNNITISNIPEIIRFNNDIIRRVLESSKKPIKKNPVKIGPITDPIVL